MLRTVALLLIGASATSAFAPSGITAPAHSRARACSSLTNIRMGKSMEAKEEIVDKVRSRLETAQLIFSTDLSGITMVNINDLRNNLPAGTNAMVIKNRLLKRAAAGTDWEAADQLTKQSNLWVIVDEDFKGSIGAFKTWGAATKKADTKNKDSKKGDIRGGVLEGRFYDAKGVSAIGDLPSKDQLYAQIAGGINGVSTMLARSLKEVPQKTARAIKLAVVPDA